MIDFDRADELACLKLEEHADAVAATMSLKSAQTVWNKRHIPTWHLQAPIESVDARSGQRYSKTYTLPRSDRHWTPAFTDDTSIAMIDFIWYHWENFLHDSWAAVPQICTTEIRKCLVHRRSHGGLGDGGGWRSEKEMRSGGQNSILVSGEHGWPRKIPRSSTALASGAYKDLEKAICKLFTCLTKVICWFCKGCMISTKAVCTGISVLLTFSSDEIEGCQTMLNPFLSVHKHALQMISFWKIPPIGVF